METNRRYIILLMAISLVSLIVACTIYIGCRESSFIIYGWVGIDDKSWWVSALRDVFDHVVTQEFVKYSLPDGLWLYSYLLLIEVIWHRNDGNAKKYFLWFVPLLAILSECLQHLSILPGTGDWNDVCAYVLSIIMYCVTIKILSK